MLVFTGVFYVKPSKRNKILAKTFPGNKRLYKYTGVLPKKAILGLWNALSSCSKNPKTLQYEADQLKQSLNNRQFPASPEEVKEARNEITKALEAEGGLLDHNSFNSKIVEAFELDIKKKANKILRHTRFNWKPLNFKTRNHAAAYTLARIMPNYAEVFFVLQEFKNNGYVPETVLDYGSGSGGAFWAAFEQWGKKVKYYELIDNNDEISQFCMDILRADGENDGFPFVHPNVSFRRFLTPSLKNTFDVIIVHRLLSEFPSRESRIELMMDLWRRTNKYLILIEGSCKGGYNALMEARDYILMGGCELHLDHTRELLIEEGVMSEQAEAILSDQQLSNYIRFNLIKNMVSPKVVLPTRLDPGYVFAPCPHDQGCPKVVKKSKDVCSFLTQWNVLRADGRKQALSTETGSFSYIIMAKGTRSPGLSQSRLLTSKARKKHVCCTICTPFNGIQRFTVSKSMGGIYKTIKCVKDGRLFPCEVKSIQSNSEFDVYEEAINGSSEVRRMNL
ncbi:unnamed protein product [Thelazia callipaeda]|uniref:Methyltransferase-like protein 17, mitochondrial n=1 Tax=Thelazia callipaeda TaxID=103827 RepID=A0A0N5CWH3_THECL|nr:unnamed protein product [Thelazia callipaeda]